MSVIIRRATRNDLPRAVALLSEAGLPVSDFAYGHLAFVAQEGEDVVGVIGVEPLGRIGLLRSLVVAADARFAGLGRQLVTALEASARTQGMDELWLLTIDADPYFERLGYKNRDRDLAPAAIKGTAEFTELCPDDAVLMSKALR